MAFSLKNITEEHIIRQLTAKCKRAPDLYGVGDDCAALEHAVISTDTMIEDVHFDDGISTVDLGWKLVAINASDIASMGKHPHWATLNLCLPRSLRTSWISEFTTGLWEALDHWSIKLIGGDTTQSPGPIVLTMTMGGSGDAPTVWRSGAQPEDNIYITGQLGKAAIGFHHPQHKDCLKAFHRPQPPVSFAVELAEGQLVHAMMDLSDGLHKDLIKLSEASSVEACIDFDLLPYPPEADCLSQKWSYIVGFGEDYEILFTAPKNNASKIKQLARKHNVNISQIGVITKRSEEKGNAYPKKGIWPPSLYSHFE